MYPRLKLLRDLLSDDGVIFVSIDDWEFDHLKLLLDEIFDRGNHINTLIWRKNAGASNDVKYFGIEHEYILCYAKEINKVDRFFTGLLDRHREEYKHKDSNFDKFGPYKRYNLYQPGIDENRPNLQYEIEAPDKSKISIKPHIWRYSKETFLEAKSAGKIDFIKNKKTGEWQVFTKIYLNESGEERRIKPRSILLEQGFTLDGNRELKRIFGEKVFNYPKPSKLVRFLLEVITFNDKNAVILDSFTGTGTTGDAVLQLNKEDKGNRKFILIEMEDKVVKEVTTQRIKKVIKLENYKDGFEYCELDKPLFNEEGQIEEECEFEQLATYIYFTETNTNLEKKNISRNSIGEYNDVEYYLLFKEKGKNILNKDFLKKISKNNKKKVIYADKCLIDDKTLEKLKIQFKQIPYEVKIY
jgi:adenine-specific DNA-methyltransferase